MGILKQIGDFLFGKDPDIFNKEGQVQHQFPDNKWQAWNNRLAANPDYDWRKHKGFTPGQKKENASSEATSKH